jgi:hypothetical protein
MLFNELLRFFYRHAHLARQSLGSAAVLAAQHNGLEAGTFERMRGLCCIERHCASQFRAAR